MTDLFKKAVVCTDIHVGNKHNSIEHNNDCLEFIQYLIDNSEGAEDFIFMGDFHHIRNSINVLSLDYTVRIFDLLTSHFKTIYFILGNHDLYYRERRDVNSVKFLEKYSNVTIIDDITIKDGVALVPWLINEEWKTINTKIKGCKYAFGHFELPSFLLNSRREFEDHGKLNMDHLKGPDYVFSGHFHKRQKKSNIYYIGNCFPHDFSDVNEESERGFMILEWDKEPRFKTWTNTPKYRTCNLSELLLNSNMYLSEKTYIKVVKDIEIDSEDIHYLRDMFTKLYKLRDFIIVNHKQNSEDYLFEEQEHFNLEEQILYMLANIDSKSIDKNKLISLYKELVV